MKEKLPPTDSRLRPDQRHLENGEFDKANAEKLRLETRQRMVCMRFLFLPYVVISNWKNSRCGACKCCRFIMYRGMHFYPRSIYLMCLRVT